MTTERIEEIQEKIDTLKEEGIQAKTRMTDLEKKWKKEYGVTDLDKIEEILETKENELLKLNKKESELTEEIEELLEEIEEHE